MRRLTNLLPRAGERGLTLIEMMVAVSIAALLALTGVPFFGDYLVNSRLREGGNSLLTDALFAQSEAIKLNGRVALVVEGSTVRVIDRSTDKILRERTMPEGVALGSATLTFGSFGRPTPFGEQPPRVILSMSGVTCSDTKRCPALVVETGGAIRLCGNKLSCS